MPLKAQGRMSWSVKIHSTKPDLQSDLTFPLKASPYAGFSDCLDSVYIHTLQKLLGTSGERSVMWLLVI